MKTYDAVIIGEGPAGITAALYLARSGCSVLAFEQLTPGGQILQTEGLENYPGFPKGIKGYELADLFAAHLDGLDIERPRGEVSSITGEAGAFVIKAEANEDTFHARSVLVCTGARHRPLGLPNEQKLIGRGVSYCALCDGNFFRNQVVAVAGGGNSALEESLYLARIAREVHIIHRRDEFRAAKIYQNKIQALGGKVITHMNSVITGLVGDEMLEGVRLKNVATNTETVLSADGLFIYIGFLPVTSYLPAALEKDPQGFIITDTEMRTNIPGIFAAGDIRSKLCRQVVTAAGDGATAAQSCFVFLEQLNG